MLTPWSDDASVLSSIFTYSGIYSYLYSMMESSTQLPSTSTAKNFEYEYEYWYWKMYSNTSTVKKFEF